MYRTSADGSSFHILHVFGSNLEDGVEPKSALVEGSDGVLYGTTSQGGANGAGTVFKLNKDGSGYHILHNFGSGFDGWNPAAELMEASDGALYGTTWSGGAFGNTNWGGYGTVFTMSKDGSGYSVIHDFAGSPGDGSGPAAGLFEGSDGALYGTTALGGTNGPNVAGTLFMLNKDGSAYGVLHNFGPAGNRGTLSDGTTPTGALVVGSDGALYGVTEQGGSNSVAGTVFKLEPDGSGYRVVHYFASPTGAGMGPYAGLIRGAGGDLYGTTTFGGNYGTVFKLSEDGSGYAVLHTFGSSTNEGTGPSAALVVGSDGALYGTTVAGGSNNAGTIFKLNPDGSGYSVLHRFPGLPAGGDGVGSESPARLLPTGDGTLYGTTGKGGLNGGGTIFKMNQDGSGYGTVHDFGSGLDGLGPSAGMLAGSGGVLYSTTGAGGGNFAGTVYSLNPDGSAYEVLYRFGSLPNANDGAYPIAELVAGSDGALYGVTSSGGGNGAGTLFRINTNGIACSGTA